MDCEEDLVDVPVTESPEWRSDVCVQISDRSVGQPVCCPWPFDRCVACSAKRPKRGVLEGNVLGAVVVE
jgi:hypothetical protein